MYYYSRIYHAQTRWTRREDDGSNQERFMGMIGYWNLITVVSFFHISTSLSLSCHSGSRIITHRKRFFLQTVRLAISNHRIQMEDDHEEKEEKEMNRLLLLPPTTHTMSICMVPPESATDVWNTIQQTRTLLKDPGLYRWPPHVNLLYPFHNIKLKCNTEDNGEDHDNGDAVLETLIEKLQLATQSIEPFEVHFTEFGTFGGKYRGCLWMNPKSYKLGTFNEAQQQEETSSSDLKSLDLPSPIGPLLVLQAELEKQFPTCNDVKKASGSFVPHLTVAQLPSLDDAFAARDSILRTWGVDNASVDCYWKNLRFTVEEIYLLKRIEDNGQFCKMATIPLGTSSIQRHGKSIHFHDPILRFESMPLYEEDWVRRERMDLKNRRNKNGRKRRTMRLHMMEEDFT